MASDPLLTHGANDRPTTTLAQGLTAPQTARSSMRFGRSVQLDAEVVVSPLGLIAIGALVSGVLLSIPPIIRAATRAR